MLTTISYIIWHKCEPVFISTIHSFHCTHLKVCLGEGWPSVTWSVWSWSGGYESEPRSGQTWGAWCFCPKSYLNQKYKDNRQESNLKNKNDAERWLTILARDRFLWLPWAFAKNSRCSRLLTAILLLVYKYNKLQECHKALSVTATLLILVRCECVCYWIVLSLYTNNVCMHVSWRGLNSLSASHDNWCTVGGDGGCRVDEVRAGTTSPMPDHKGFKLQ